MARGDGRASARPVVEELELSTRTPDQNLHQVDADLACTGRSQGARRSPEATELPLGCTSARSPSQVWFELTARASRERNATRLDLDAHEQTAAADHQIDFGRFRVETTSQDPPALSSQVLRGEALSNNSECLRRERTVPQGEARCESCGNGSQNPARKRSDSDRRPRPGAARVESRRPL